MKKTIKATNIELTDAVSSYVDKIISTIEKHIDPQDTSALVDIEVGKTSRHHKSGDIFMAEVNLHTRFGDFRSVAKTADLYSAIDEVKDELADTLSSKKRRRIDVVRRSARVLKDMVRGAYDFGQRGWRRAYKWRKDR